MGGLNPLKLSEGNLYFSTFMFFQLRKHVFIIAWSIIYQFFAPLKVQIGCICAEKSINSGLILLFGADVLRTFLSNNSLNKQGVYLLQHIKKCRASSACKFCSSTSSSFRVSSGSSGYVWILQVFSGYFRVTIWALPGPCGLFRVRLSTSYFILARPDQSCILVVMTIKLIGGFPIKIETGISLLISYSFAIFIEWNS